MDLKQKGADAVIGNFKQMKVSLIWTAEVDLDLMAFYKTKDGRTGGIYSDNYAGGSLGDLNAFPFVQLSGDEGVGAGGGSKREELRVARLDDFEELHICALNFTDASTGQNRVFADYDASVEVVTDKGETHVVTLDSKTPGAVAVICTFKSSFMGASIANSSDVMGLEDFRANIPGASELKVASKIVLKEKGQKAPLSGKDFHAILRWKTAVDLDLHCFYRLKADAAPAKKGLMGKLLGGSGSGRGHVYFGDRGSRENAPWVYLDQDAGVGDKGGDNEENLYFTRLETIEHALIAANIFNKPNSNFSAYDGRVMVRGGGREIEVPLTESSPGSWCLIARIDNSGPGGAQLINVNQVRRDEPVLD